MPERPEWNYLKKKKVSYQFKTDPTESWFITKNGRKVARNISTTFGGHQSFLLWKGWYTRLDRAARLLTRLDASRNRFWDKVAKPELLAHLGKKESVKVHYLDKDNILNYVEISKRGGDDGEGIAYSSHCRAENKNGQATFRLADVIQTKGWDSLYKGWEDGFKDGQRLVWALNVLGSKWNRFYRAQAIVTHLIHKKLEKIADQHKTGDVIEFVCGDRRHRFEKQDRRHAQGDGIWKELSAKEIQTVDISAIIPKYP